MRDVLDHDEITKLLSRIMRGSRRVERSSDDWLAPIGMPRFKGPGGSGEPVLFSIDRDFDIEFDQSAQETTRVLALLLQSQLAAPEQADAHYVEREIMSAIGEVKSGAAKDKGLGQRLADRVAKRFARSVTVVPVGGLDFLGVEEVAKLRDRVLLGPFNDATESVFDSFAKEFTGHSFHFTSDVWWTENVLAFRSEPALFEDGPPGEGIGLIAVAIDSVDVGAVSGPWNWLKPCWVPCGSSINGQSPSRRRRRGSLARHPPLSTPVSRLRMRTAPCRSASSR